MSRTEMAEDRAAAKFWRIALLVWCCFIVYGSLIPFRFIADPDVVLSNLAKVELFPYQAGVKNFSFPDVVSNVLLFIPFGFLVARSRFQGLGRGWPLRIGVIGVLALGMAAAIELGQLFAAGRRSSGIDVEFEVLGALVGGVGAHVLERYDTRVEAGRHAVHKEPALVPIALVFLWLCADAFYPFAVTLDVSTAWHNLKHARWIPFRGPQGFWPDRLVDEGVAFVILSALIRSALGRYAPAPVAALLAMTGTLALSVMLEAGKLLVVGRLPNSENVLLAFAGAACGVVVAPLLMAWPPIRKRPGRALALLALGLLVYSELTPFAFVTSWPALAAQVGRIEWLPLRSYSRADAQSALFDLWRKLLLSGFWGFSFSWAAGATPWRAARAGLLVGGALEAAQVLTMSRMSSVGDALILGLGAGIGGIAYRRYQAGATMEGAARADV